MVGKRVLYLLLVIGVVALGAGSYAVAKKDGAADPPNEKHFKAFLNGFQETPSNSTTGWGTFEAWLVDDTTLHYVLHYADLDPGSTTTTQAHVHLGQRGFNGGVSFFLCGSTKPACTPTEGTFEGDVTPADVIGPNAQGIEPGSFAEIIRGMQAGHAYANVHTNRWPAGEIRGQINDEDQKEFDR
jgi:hypothetical protein